MTDFLIDGDGEKTFIMAHGAGAPMDSDFMTTVANGLAASGIRVVRFEFPYMVERREAGKKRPPNRMPTLEESYRDVWNQVSGRYSGAVFVGGKSMGGRVASRLADQLGAAGCICFGYPFHPPRKPEKLRTAHLEELQTRCLIVQGTRDKFGVPDDVAGYALSDAIDVVWIEDGDHSLVPRKRSGRTEEDNLTEAIAAAATFMNAET